MRTSCSIAGWCSRIAAVAALLVTALLTGCFFEKIAWSPDGRFAYFTGHEESGFWVWDSETGLTKEVELRVALGGLGTMPVDEEVTSCRATPAGDDLLVMTKDKQDDDRYNVYLYDPKSDSCAPIASAVMPYFDISRDGRQFYTITKGGGSDENTLWVTTRTDEAKALMTRPDDFGYPRIGPHGKRLIYSSENALHLLDIASGKSRVWLAAPDCSFFWPAWVDEDRALYYSVAEGDSEEALADLQVYSFDEGSTRSLCRDVYMMYPPSFASDRRSVAVTVVGRGSDGEIEEDHPMAYQIASVDLATGLKTWLTDTPFAALAPSWSPDVRRLAYLTFNGGDEGMLEVVDIASNKRTLAWRNEEERLLADGDALAQNDEARPAIDKWQELVVRFPETELRDAAWYRITMTCREAPISDDERTSHALEQIQDDDLREQAITALSALVK